MNSEAGNAGASRPVSIWQRAGRKFKFVSSNKEAEGQGEDVGEKEEDIATTALSAKQKRRAQVRKAQKFVFLNSSSPFYTSSLHFILILNIEHREIKANYAKHLEQDIIDLRSLIAKAEAEALLAQQENNAVRKALLQAQIPISLPQQPSQNTGLDQPFTFNPKGPLEPPPLNINAGAMKPPSGTQEMQWFPTEGSMKVSTFFDQDLSKTILKVSPRENKPKQTEGGQGQGTAEFDAFPENILKEMESEGESRSLATSLPIGKQPPPEERQPQTSILAEKEMDFPATAVNFILALEHPCRTHFHAPDPIFSPTTPETGHQLLASTLLYTSAPPRVFPALSAAVPVPSFTHPSSSLSTLQTLKQMSNSLPKGDWEITPVQAWFRLVDKYGIRFLMEEGRIERLRRALVGLVERFEFGVVMVESELWEVVRRCFLDVALREEREGVREWI
ncbi:hypothetical protein HYALB_00002958 [Hymenoscyphus albidus]|uniref:Uncharacterized protein n=1 Tax=Hymenoscyphus albidus TaxID=595503 RepID=A0A9N9M215_9HELO|nr:hypothetical protein HYALB_00002958 [Hymenoscyphus albidus]